MVASSSLTWSAPGSPTLVSPVRIGDWPVMNRGASGSAALLPVPIGEQLPPPSLTGRCSAFGTPITPRL